MHDYGFKPDGIFHRADSDPHSRNLFAGTEDEFSHESWSDRSETIDAVYDIFGDGERDFYLKNDSSTERGVEMVSHPRTLASWEELRPKMSDFFERISENVIEGRDGLHVHLSRSGMSPSHMVRFGAFIAAEQDNVTVIARRTSDQWARYHKKPKTGADLMDCGRSDTRYSAVNWLNKRTVEVRVFRSTTSVMEFYAAIQFCHAAYQFTKSCITLQRILKGEAWPAFLTFVKDNEDRYGDLLKLWNRDCPSGEEV